MGSSIFAAISFSALVALLPVSAHAGYVTGGPFIGGDLSYLTSPWGTEAFVFTERLGAELTYMPVEAVGFGVAVNLKGPRSYTTSPLFQLLGSSSEALQYVSVAAAPHVYVRLGGHPGETQYGMRFAFGVTWSRWSEVDTDTPDCGDFGYISDNAGRRAASGCSTTVTTHPTRELMGFVGRLQQLSLLPLGCSGSLGFGPYFETEGLLQFSVGMVVELMANSDAGNCTSSSRQE